MWIRALHGKDRCTTCIIFYFIKKSSVYSKPRFFLVGKLMDKLTASPASILFNTQAD